MPPKKRTRKGAKPILETPFRVLEDENQAGPSTQHVTSPTTSIDPIISINTQSLTRSGRVIKPRRLQEYDYCDDEPASTFDPEELDISSDSDQSDEEQQDEDEIPVVAGETPAEQDKAPKNPWMSKDQGTIWTSISPSPNQRTRSHNFLKVPEIGGPTDPNGTFNMSPVELFKMFVTTDHVRIILRHSNAHALSFRPAWKEIDEDELYSFIRILLFAGVDKRRNFPIDEIWSSDFKYLTVPIVATMSRTRFKDILRFLRFDDREAREQARRENNPVPKIGLVQEIFDPFVKALRDHFLPGKTLTVDEMLLRFRGRTKFRVYMKSKPGKYGIKVWVIVDADTGYILMMYIYEGKQGKDVDTGLGRKVVMQPAEPFLDKGRSITTDNFFTSMALANELLDRETTLLGTIRGHRVEIPPILANKKGRDPLSSTFGFHKDFTLVSYAPKKNRVVLLLSTEHHDDMVDDEDNPKKNFFEISAYLYQRSD